MVVYATHVETRTQAHALLARASALEWGLSPLPDMAKTAEGKPFFPNFPQYQFNLSHSGPHALCALDSGRVGADIQVIRRDLRENLPRRVCSPEELAWLDGQHDRWAGFALLWALKEARGKYDGRGLAAGVRELSVPLPQEGESLYRHDGLWFRIYQSEGYMAAVCGENPPCGELIWL